MTLSVKKATKRKLDARIRSQKHPFHIFGPSPLPALIGFFLFVFCYFPATLAVPTNRMAFSFLTAAFRRSCCFKLRNFTTVALFTCSLSIFIFGPLELVSEARCTVFDSGLCCEIITNFDGYEDLDQTLELYKQRQASPSLLSHLRLPTPFETGLLLSVPAALILAVSRGFVDVSGFSSKRVAYLAYHYLPRSHYPFDPVAGISLDPDFGHLAAGSLSCQTAKEIYGVTANALALWGGNVIASNLPLINRLECVLELIYGKSNALRFVIYDQIVHYNLQVSTICFLLVVLILLVAGLIGFIPEVRLSVLNLLPFSLSSARVFDLEKKVEIGLATGKELAHQTEQLAVLIETNVYTLWFLLFLDLCLLALLVCVCVCTGKRVAAYSGEKHSLTSSQCYVNQHSLMLRVSPSRISSIAFRRSFFGQSSPSPQVATNLQACKFRSCLAASPRAFLAGGGGMTPSAKEAAKRKLAARIRSQKHPFHILGPSPLPALTGFFLFAGLVPQIFSRHGYETELPRADILHFAVLGLFFTIRNGFLEILRESGQGYHTKPVQAGLRLGRLLFIASEVRFFFAFFGAFFHFSLIPSIAIGAVGPPVGTQPLDPGGLPLVNTRLLLTSGVTITIAHAYILNNNQKGFEHYLLLTIILGTVFLFCQGYEYKYGVTFSGRDNIYGSIFFATTGFHGLHVTIGTLFLLFCGVRQVIATRELKRYGRRELAFTPKHHFGFEAAAGYGHFVDVVGLFLFITIYGGGGAC